MTRTSPAIEIRFIPDGGAPGAVDLRDRLLVTIDDYGPVAIEEVADVWRVFFESHDARARAASRLANLGLSTVAIETIDVDDEDWAARSQRDLRPVRAGRVIMAPPWALDDARHSAATEDVVVTIVPSTGFGTGHHASTRLCLQLLQQITVRDRSVLDVGTGSGVLAIAACRLGARAAVAIDNDPDAVAAARENVALNHLEDVVQIELADLRTGSIPQSDVVLANLTGTLLRQRAADLLASVNPGGDCIVSGVLDEDARDVVTAFEGAGARLASRLAEDAWVGFHFAKGRACSVPTRAI